MIGQSPEAKVSLEKYRQLTRATSVRRKSPTSSAICTPSRRERIKRLRNGKKALNSRPTPARAGNPVPLRALPRRFGRIRKRALRAYRKAIDNGESTDPYRLSALAHAAAIYEKQGQVQRALAAYRDLIRHANDPELVSAAEARAQQLKPGKR